MPQEQSSSDDYANADADREEDAVRGQPDQRDCHNQRGSDEGGRAANGDSHGHDSENVIKDGRM